MRRAQPWLGTLVEISIAGVAEPASSGSSSQSGSSDPSGWSDWAGAPDAAIDTAIGAALDSAIDAAFAAIALVHAKMSFHDPASDVSALNRLPVGGRLWVDPHTAAVLRCALLLEQASDGLFNLGCGGVLAARGFLPAAVGDAGDASDSVPAATASTAHTARQPSAAHPTSGTSRLPGSTASPHPALLPQVVDLPTQAGALPPKGGALPPQAGALLRRAVVAVNADGSVTKRCDAWIDLGGIAKGYAVDLAVASLRAAGIAAGCVNAGGDLRVFGPVDFPVLLRDPLHPGRAILELRLREQALATSATYFSRRTVAGVDTSALLDGTDGSPVVHAHSASVLAPDCMLADGLTKVVMASTDANHPAVARFGATALLL